MSLSSSWPDNNAITPNTSNERTTKLRVVVRVGLIYIIAIRKTKASTLVMSLKNFNIVVS